MDSTQISDRDQEADYLYAMRLASGSVLPMVLKSAIELDVLEIIARAGPGGSMSPNEIASHLPTSNPDAPLMLDRMLRLLASYSILTCSLRSLPDGKVERLYGLAPVCKYFTKNEDGVSLSAFSLLGQDKVVMESWYCFKDAVLEGGVPFEKTHGMAWFECLSINPTFNKIFNNAMASISTITLKKILETYKGFEGLKSVIDVGGGTGAALNMIISIYPTIRGINFDLPHVIKDAPSYPGVTHVEGDLFVSIPKGGDAIFLKWICHDWSDEHCLKLLKNCHEALPDDGKMFVCEWILPAALDPSLKSNVVLHFDCIMMSSFKDGKERTEDEFKALAKAAGFQGFQLVRCAPAIYIMEFLKKT